MSETLGDGATEQAAIILYEYSSWIFEINKFPFRSQYHRQGRGTGTIETGSVVISSQSRGIRALEALGALSLLPHDVKHLVDELCTLGIVYGTRVD